MAGEFVVPTARDPRGRLVVPAEADRAVRYTCPSCDGPVDLHAGEKKRRHFHHRAGASACTSESVLHLSAKRLVVQAVDDWLAGTHEAPVFVRTCAHAKCMASTRQPLPKKVGAAVVEHRLRSDHVVDAAQVCESGGRVLVPISDRFLPWLCPDHAETRGERHAAQRRDRERLAAVVRHLDYRLAEYPGYRAERVTSCPNGHDAIVFGWDGRSPPDPRPPHVVAFEAELDATFRRGAGWKKLLPYRRSFGSVCPSCGARLEEG